MSAIWEPWVPVEGQRVRVRLSGECRATMAYWKTTADDPWSSDETLKAVGHDPREDGAVGEVSLDDGPDEPTNTFDAHRFLVYFDQPVCVTEANCAQASVFYAAAELEPA